MPLFSNPRVYTNPPDLVLTVMYAVCILLQQKPTWAVAKQLLADPAGFLKRLVSLDKDSLPEKVFLSLRRYSKDPEFTPENVGRVSTACRSMCQWVLALDNYHDVLKIIEPKQKKVRVAEEALAKAKWNLKEKEKNLSRIEQHQASLQERYNASVEEKVELAARKELTTKRLQRAGQLIAALSDEKDRWKSSVAELDSQLKHIVGDTIISAAFITYCGPLSTSYREAIVKTWLESCRSADIAVSNDYTFIGTMTKKNEIQHWRTTGLPSDRMSTENALIIENGPHWPLIIDPQGQAQRWLSRKEGVRLYNVQASNPSYMKTVERAIRTGDAVLIQDVTESVDPCLRPLLEKKITVHRRHSIIKIGDNEVEYNPNFRLYLTTSLPNPHFLPNLCIIMKLVNFNMEYEGLREQLLASALTLQQPQLENQHSQLLHTITSLLSDLHQLEERSLQLLQDTMGHILDDQSLIDNLRKTKETFRKVSQRVQSTREKEREMAKVRKKYLPIARHAANLYTVLAELAQINYMYQFSLEWFMGKYTQALQWGGQASERSTEGGGTCATHHAINRTDFETDDFRQHLLTLMDLVTEIIYKDVSLALFAEHQLCFSFLMCCRVMQQEEEDAYLPSGCSEPLPAEEWRTFLHTPMLADILAGRQRQPAQAGAPAHWLADSTWNQCLYLGTQLSAFSGFCQSLQSCPCQWRAFQQADALYGFLALPHSPCKDCSSPPAGQPAILQSAEQQPAPTKTKPGNVKSTAVFAWEKLTGFQRLILIKVLRPDCLTSAVRRFVTEKIGAKFVEGSKMSLLEIYEHSNSSTPIIFLLSPGMDPASVLLRLAQELHGSSLHVDMVSLGQGQGKRADQLLSKAQVQKGRWVFLQNCHLAASFMTRLQAIVNSLKWKGSDLDPHFRLWLSSKPDPNFPACILQRGLKVAVEAPQGLKQKLLHLVGVSGEVTEKTFSKPECGPAWKTLVFSLCFFHTVIQERKKYDTLGWNIPYMFTSADLEVSLLNQEMMLKGCEGEEVPWAALRYLIGEVVYGGHTMDPWDQRCMDAILEHCYNPPVLQEGPIFCQGQGYPAFPKDASWSQCCAFIQNMPDEDVAEALGMAGSAEALVQQHQAQQLLQTIVGLQPQLSSVHQQSRDAESQAEVALRLADYILEKLPERMEPGKNVSLQDVIAKMGSKAKEDGGQRPLALLVVLKEEVRRFERLLGGIHSSLLSFCSAARGETLMTQSTEEILNALLTMTVPPAWKVLSYESCMALGSWVLDLEQRVKFFQAWSDHVKMKYMKRTELSTGTGRPIWQRCMKMLSSPKASEHERPRSYWLSGFFFPQGFLTAVLQEYARKRNLSVDSLCFRHHVQPLQEATPDWSTIPQKSTLLFEGAEPPEDGVLVYGLYLSGASWHPESQTLQEALPKLQNYPMPEIHFLPCQRPDDLPPHHPETTEQPEVDGSEWERELFLYECPLYCTSKRTGHVFSTGLSSNFITAMALPTTQPPSHWIFRGTAMLCQLDE
ncbi:hypothetical protein ACEWY4_005339 [Coilia grayii]|uniref:Dynein heavy chain n=1 Tax=Coilia grayii TaxID=363190 RepID=A0ABD1KI96_9TELE